MHNDDESGIDVKLSVYDKLIGNVYKTKVPHPLRADYETSETYTSASGKSIVQKGFDQAAYVEARKVHYADERRLTELFKQDALAELGLTDHPKAEKLWTLANERCHDGGLIEVWHELDSLAGLLKD